MTRERVNPHSPGTAEHVLHERWRKSKLRADQLQREATLIQQDADAERAKADRYAQALAALGTPPVQPLQIAGPKP